MTGIAKIERRSAAWSSPTTRCVMEIRHTGQRYSSPCIQVDVVNKIKIKITIKVILSSLSVCLSAYKNGVHSTLCVRTFGALQGTSQGYVTATYVPRRDVCHVSWLRIGFGRCLRTVRAPSGSTHCTEPSDPPLPLPRHPLQPPLHCCD